MIVRTFLEWLTARLTPPRVIFNRVGTGPYLSRWYLKGRPTMPDGSSPFDATGGSKPEAIDPEGVGIYIHRFHESDDLDFHNHPCVWSFSIILAGGYFEERRHTDGTVTRRRVRPGMINVIRNTDFHRVELVDADGWSLFVVGPKCQSWGFWDVKLSKYLPWREYIQVKRGGAP